MEIKPHENVDSYYVDGFPLSSLEAFILYINGVEIASLKTSNKTVSGAINELWDMINDLDLSDYVKQDAFNALKKAVEDNAADIGDIRGDIVEIRAKINNIDERLKSLEALRTNIPVVTNVAVTNPDYWSQGHKNAYATNDHVVIEYIGEYLQELSAEDGTLEVVNVTLNRNVEIDMTKTPDIWYGTMVMDAETPNGQHQTSIVPVKCQWSSEQNSYDISVYYTVDRFYPAPGEGAVTKGNVYITLMVPYQPVKEG